MNFRKGFRNPEAITRIGVNFRLYLNQDENEFLEKVSQESFLSKAEIMRRLIREYMNKKSV